MEYDIQLKSFKEEKGVKYKILEITDVALHTKPGKPSNNGKRLKKILENNTPGRIYRPITDMKADPDEEKKFKLEILKSDPDFVKMIQEEEAKGYKIVLAFPKGGIPLLAGKDTVEFMNSKNGKRAHRGFAKKNKKK